MIRLTALLALAACSEDRPAPSAPVLPDGGGQEGGPDAAGPDAAASAFCDPERSFGAPTRIGPPTAELERFASISGNELSIAWVVPIDDATATVMYADRTSASEAFGAPRTLIPAEGYFALDRVALDHEGLRLAVVRADRHGFGVAVRASGAEPFGAPEPEEYSNLNPYQREVEPRDSFVGDPVISADGLAFVYSEYGGDIQDTVRVSLRQFPEDAWTSTEAFSVPELAREGELRRRPTGISTDLKTLFFWDEIAGAQRAAWRPTPLEPFDHFVDLGAFEGAQPNATCRRLYVALDGDLAVAEAAD